MSGYFVLDWAILAVSLANTILLLWLGLTVLLNAERRSWGVWTMGIGLLLGAAFFVSHTAILGSGLQAASAGMNFWWRVGWVPVLLAPLAWYVVILWYAGFWEDRPSRLYRRQRVWVWVMPGAAAGLVGLLIFANPLPSFTQVAQLDLSATPTIAGIPVLLIVYPAYIVQCIALSLDALRNPGPSRRVMGDLARQRTRPWLAGASATLLAVSLLVALAMLWIESSIRFGRFTDLYSSAALVVGWFDLIIESLIGLAAILAGQAIVAYEVFTGQTLPRRGFFRHWRSAVILAGGYGGVIGGLLAANVQPVYGLLATAVIMTTFYALFGWRSFAERERFVSWLRPLVGRRGVIQTPGGTGSEAARRIFEALCDQVLGAGLAHLVPMGSMAPLAGPVLRFPKELNRKDAESAENNEMQTLTPGPSPTGPDARARQGRGEGRHIGGRDQPGIDFAAELPPLPEAALVPGADWIELDADRYQGAQWAIPLWSERGLIGALLLGEKRDGGLFTQEELAIARAGGERLIEMMAGEEMARRLMGLQRERLARTQVMDRQARRALHDDILPELHTAILGLSGPAREHEAAQAAIQTLSGVHHRISDLIHTLPGASEARTGGLIAALKALIEEEFAGEFEGVRWEIEGDISLVSEVQEDVIYHAFREVVRNAAVHGRGGDSQRPLRLHIQVRGGEGLNISVQDDGVGPAGGATAGSQHGLALHGTLMIVVGGSLQIEAAPDGGTRVQLSLPDGAITPGSAENRAPESRGPG